MKNYGFTLIELIVVIAILGVISAIGIASLVSYSRSASLDNNTKDLAQMLLTAKQKAYDQVKPSACSSSTQQDSLTGYEVDINKVYNPVSCSPPINSSNFYVLYAICSKNCVKVSEGTLATNLSFSASNNFFFPVLTGGVLSSNGQTVTIKGYNQSKTITVSQNGTVTTN